ncbi:MAG TPA: hypothetical protein EYG89_03740 [Bacteroidia bacterium]|nr:hypothetical protein [Bacteroidia bacterium]
MSNVAYQERDLKAIKRREKINFFYKAFRKLCRLMVGYKDKQIKSIATYPAIKTEEALIEIVNKLAWAIPKKDGLKVYITVADKLVNFDFSGVKVVEHQRNYLTSDISHIVLTKDFTPNVDLILYTEAKLILKSNPLNLYKTDILDKNYFSTVEGGLLQSIYHSTLSKDEKQKIENLSLKNYKDMLELNKNKSKSYCFVTGPSFDRYKEFIYEKDAFKVICNSTVKNDDFLEFIGSPDLLTFADPVFHFSPSEYSAVFRDHVLKVYKKYKPYIVVPETTVALLLAHHPELENRIIGMKGQKEPFNFPTVDKFWIKSSANILTLYMIPFASAVSNEINIIGADGRKPDEKYFWQHSKSAQFGDLMQTVFDTHPSFFRDRDYKDYYNEHCEFLNNLIEYGESKGKKYYSLTKSFIPVLKERLKNG